MDVLSFETEVRQLIGLQQEGEYWDFKKEWHQNKADLLHDIIYKINGILGGVSWKAKGRTMS